MAEPIAVLVVDDEAPARMRLRELLAREADAASVRDANDGHAALSILTGPEPPDLVFLDVQMPGMSGLELLRAVGPERMPLTVFVIAFDRHAIAAFDAQAADYLLKPFGDARFEAAFTRARLRLDQRREAETARSLSRLIAALGPGAAAEPPLRVVPVRVAGGAIRLVRAADIERIEGAGPYVELVAGGERLLHRATLADLARRLDPATFVRVHRSTILNVEHVLRLESRPHGEFEAVLRGGARCRVSRSGRPALERHLGQAL